jgi:hypothetical protein
MTLGLLFDILKSADPNLLVYGVSKIRVEPPFIYLMDQDGNELKPTDFIKEFIDERIGIDVRI